MSGHTCCNKQKVKRGLWSPEEDEKLVDYVSRHGHGCWSYVAQQAGLERCGKSCRLRWINYLRPDLKRGNFTSQEASLIIELHRFFGNRWAQIARYLPGRTDNEVKNFWNSNIKKQLLAARQNMAANPNNASTSAENYLPYHPQMDNLNPITPETSIPPPPPPMDFQGFEEMFDEMMFNDEMMLSEVTMSEHMVTYPETAPPPPPPEAAEADPALVVTSLSDLPSSSAFSLNTATLTDQNNLENQVIQKVESPMFAFDNSRANFADPNTENNLENQVVQQNESPMFAFDHSSPNFVHPNPETVEPFDFFNSSSAFVNPKEETVQTFEFANSSAGFLSPKPEIFQDYNYANSSAGDIHPKQEMLEGFDFADTSASFVQPKQEGDEFDNPSAHFVYPKQEMVQDHEFGYSGPEFIMPKEEIAQDYNFYDPSANFIMPKEEPMEGFDFYNSSANFVMPKEEMQDGHEFEYQSPNFVIPKEEMLEAYDEAIAMIDAIVPEAAGGMAYEYEDENMVEPPPAVEPSTDLPPYHIKNIQALLQSFAPAAPPSSSSSGPSTTYKEWF